MSPRRPAPKTINLPAFQSRDVRFWFVQVEAMFRNGNVFADQTKYDYVVAALDLAAADYVRELLEDPPAADLYATLKKALVDRLAVSEDTRIRRLLSGEDMGDRRPSQFLRHLQALGGKSVTETVLKNIWMESLPADVKLVVASADELPLDKMADMADRVADVASCRRSVAAVSAQPAPTQPVVEDRLDFLAKQISALAKKMDNHLTKRNKEKEGATRPKQARGQSPHPAPVGSESPICWYHRKFKELATKCTQPCAWAAAGSAGNGQSRQ